MNSAWQLHFAKHSTTFIITMSILNINDLALQLVALDFSDDHIPNNPGPTKTSRALAIIHLAAHDAYAQVTKKLTPKLKNIPNVPGTLDNEATTASLALLGAGFRAAMLLYPDFELFISTEAAKVADIGSLAYQYGEEVAEAWVNSRISDGSQSPQTDRLFNQASGRHRPDPLNPQQEALGRNWGLVTPFILNNVVVDAPLDPPPSLDSLEYAEAYNQVISDGKNNIVVRDPAKAVVGIFWGYDGANKIGVPPRIYNQVVRAIPEFKMATTELQIKILTAVNVAMADAGIAAWHWKYQYDFWRPVVGIREADAAWGAQCIGDGNVDTKGDPFWLPLGAPNSNSKKPNGTPGFPAYPSGHATFGAACFNTAATLLGKNPEDIQLEFVSDEFNGVTTDNTGAVRPRYKANFTLRQAIDENNISRIYLGVHWKFDATGGEKVGVAIASKVIAAFQ
jgi:membrane-associated phospholipid phosphatase